MRLRSTLRRVFRFRLLAVIGSGGFLLGSLPSCTQESLNRVWIDALEGAISSGLPSVFEAIRIDVLEEEETGGPTDVIPTVLRNTIDTLTTMKA